MKNFGQRTLTGILFVLIIVGGIIFNPISFFLVFFIISILGMIEMHQMVKSDGTNPSFFLTLLCGSFVYVSSSLVFSGVSQPKLFYLFIPIVLSVFIVELFRKEENPIRNIGATFLIVLMVTVPFALLQKIAFLNGYYNFRTPLIIFVLVWLNDTGAYLFGVTIGKHKMFARISPKKSWEGTFGGLLVTLLGAGEIFLLWPAMSLTKWLILGVLVSVFAVFGDLSESMLKRSFNIKDSGNLLPGHGGVLDRFDSILFVIPITLFFISYFC